MSCSNGQKQPTRKERRAERKRVGKLALELPGVEEAIWFLDKATKLNAVEFMGVLKILGVQVKEKKSSGSIDANFDARADQVQTPSEELDEGESEVEVFSLEELEVGDGLEEKGEKSDIPQPTCKQLRNFPKSRSFDVLLSEMLDGYLRLGQKQRREILLLLHDTVGDGRSEK